MRFLFPRDHVTVAEAAWILQVTQYTLRRLGPQLREPSGDAGLFDAGRRVWVSVAAMRLLVEQATWGAGGVSVALLNALVAGDIEAPRWESPKGQPPPLTAYRQIGASVNASSGTKVTS